MKAYEEAEGEFYLKWVLADADDKGAWDGETVAGDWYPAHEELKDKDGKKVDKPIDAWEAKQKVD